MADKTFLFNDLNRIAGKYSEVTVKESKSGRILCTAYGARILGMFPSGDKHNVLWVNNNLDEIMAASGWFIGGERLWIAPERNFFYENPRDFDGFHIPAGIDPGEYVQKGDLCYENIFPLLDYQSNLTFDDTVAAREFAMISDPYESGLDYIGVRIKDSVSVPAQRFDFCGWSLSQVYTCGSENPGTAFFPIARNGMVLSYFKPIPSNRKSVEDGYARFLIDSAEIYKLAIRPEDMVFSNPAKALYVSPLPDSSAWFCIVKRSADMPRSQAECVDIAKGNPSGPKGAIQSYNSGLDPQSPMLFFGEIELQLNKGILVHDRTISAAYHELLSYMGPKDAILALTKRILGSETEPKLY